MSAPAKASCSKRLLIELNVKTFEATFYNGKKLSIEYLFHSEVMGEECLQVGLNSLKPLFGGIIPPGIPQFTHISELSNFLRLINMDDCSHGDYASCACRHKIEPGQEHSDYRCRDNHWHHYCTGHVHQWLQFYLERAILLKESRKHYEYRVSEVHGPVTGFYYSCGEMATAEYWLSPCSPISAPPSPPSSPDIKPKLRQTKEKSIKEKKSTYKPRGRRPKYKFKRLWCEPCEMKFETREESEAHRLEKHPETDPWMCEICGKVFNHRGSHYTHVRSHLPPVHACNQCDYKTWHRHDLIKHLRIHAGDKKYQCTQCARTFHTSSNLTSHVRRTHDRARPHQCGQCQRRFFDRTKLRRHQDSHDDIKRFECEVCHSCFTRRCYWKKHLQKQHSVTVPPQRPGRRKLNLLVGEELLQAKSDAA